MKCPAFKYTFRWLVLASLTLFATCAPYIEYNPIADVLIQMEGTNVNQLVFGVSTGNRTENSVKINPDGSVRIKASNSTNNAGKIAGSEDGISFYFKEVDASKNFKLSGTITVHFFGGRDFDGTITSNGQEAFGLMARDYIPQYPGYTIQEVAESVANGGEYQARPVDPATGKTFGSIPGGSSNMVMVGAVKRGVRAAIRRGVYGPVECITDPNTIAVAGKSIFEFFPKELQDYSMYPTLDARPEFPADNTVYRFSLIKTNSAFIATITPPADRGTVQEYIMPYPDILTVINKDKYYVGFFAARSAEITVSNISYYESDSADDAPAIEPEPEVFVPHFTIDSNVTTSDDDYKIFASSNVKGYISVTQDGVLLEWAEFLEGTWYSSDTMPSEAAVMHDICVFEVPTLPLHNGENVFNIIFYPDENQSISSNQVIQKILTVNRKAYFDVDTPIYVSNTGRSVNAGTITSPLDIDTAIAYVQPGQKIVLLNGTYELKSLVIPKHNNGRRLLSDGTSGRKKLVAETDDMVFIDFKKNIEATGMVLRGDFWQIEGIHVRNTPDKVKGFTIMGHNNEIKRVKTYNNGDTGLQISGTSTESRTWWPTNNTVSYCESYNNKDAAQIDADGFAAKLTIGAGNKFEWCVSHNNCDDGWDLFTKKETGKISPVIIENCIAYRNGTLMDGTKTRAGRNGFKLGGEGLGVMHVVKNCLSFQNGAHGFTSNSNSDIQLEYCTSFDNGTPEWNISTDADSRNFTIYNASGKIDAVTMKRKITGILSLFSDGTGRSEDKVILVDNSSGYAWLGSMNGSTTGTAYKCIEAGVLVGVTTNSGDLVENLTVPVDSEGFISRDSQGRFILNNFLAVKPGVANNPGASFVY